MRARALMLVTLLVSSLSVVGPPTPATAQPLSGVQLAFGPGFPSMVTVGEQNRSAAIFITNTSFGALGTVPVTVTNIRMNPSCDSGAVQATGEPCTAPEARALPGPIFNIDPVAVGRAGTACAGQVFTVSPPTPTAPSPSPARPSSSVPREPRRRAASSTSPSTSCSARSTETPSRWPTPSPPPSTPRSSTTPTLLSRRTG